MVPCIPPDQLHRIEIKNASIAQAGVKYNEGIFTVYLDKRLEGIAPNADAFLRLQAKQFIDITQKGISDENKKKMQKNTFKQIVASLAVFALGYYSMNYFSAALISFPVWFLAHKLKSGTNDRIQAEEVDAKVIKESSSDVLKGGILFYKAYQNVNQNKNSFFFTRSGDSRFPNLESTPALAVRISQLEQELKDRQIDPHCAEEDQKTIEQIKHLFYSNV